MNSYTGFLKANRSLLFSLHSLKNKQQVRVGASRQALPGLFAKHLAQSWGQEVKVVYGNPNRLPTQPNLLHWVVMPESSGDADFVLTPLAKRPADIPLLLRHFFSAQDLTLDDWRHLKAHGWEGDLLQMFALAQAKSLRPNACIHDLLSLSADELMLRNLVGMSGLEYWSELIGFSGLKGATDLFADQLIDLLLPCHAGSIAGLARFLRIPPTTLYSRITNRKKRSTA
jgi:hypothetical protein